MFNWMIIGMSGIVLLFGIAWWLSPALRRWSEAPKYRMLERERQFDRAAPRAPAPDEGDH